MQCRTAGTWTRVRARQLLLQELRCLAQGSGLSSGQSLNDVTLIYFAIVQRLASGITGSGSRRNAALEEVAFDFVQHTLLLQSCARCVVAK